MRSLNKLNIEKSIKSKKLIYTESWVDKFDKINILFVFGLGFVLPFLGFFNPNINTLKIGIELNLLFIFSTFCVFVIYRKVTEKNLTEIESFYDIDKNRKIITEYCEKMGFEKYRNAKNIIIYNSNKFYDLNSNYKKSRIFLFEGRKIYFTMIQDGWRLNIPVLFSQIILKNQIKKLVKS